MNNEDLYASLAMGGVLGVFAFVAGLIRVRRWNLRLGPAGPRPDSSTEQGRYSPDRPIQSPSGTLFAFFAQFAAIDRLGDLLGLLFIVAMLLYGAWVAPRLRLIVAVAIITVALCCLGWRGVGKLLKRA